MKKDCIYPLHNPLYNLDEDTLTTGIIVLGTLLKNICNVKAMRGENSVMNRYNSILIEDNDNVVTALWDIEKGETVTAMGLEDKVVAKENIKKRP